MGHRKARGMEAIMDTNNERNNDVKTENDKGISLDELEKMSGGGGGMESGYSHKTGDMPTGGTK